jgi:glycosyltransferase involved in cell wall biosynthesis
MTNILHISKYPPGQGGMDFIQDIHAQANEPCLAFLHRKALPKNRTRWGNELDISPSTPLAWLQWRARQALAQQSAPIQLFYNCWGADLLTRTHNETLRVGYIHSDFPHFTRYIQHFDGWLDGFLSVSPALANRVRAITGKPVADIACALQGHQTIESPSSDATGRELVLGYSGRVALEQKRLDRLPAFLELLDKAAIPYRFEILGDGPYSATLAQRLGNHPRVRWHGWRTAAEMDAILKTWRYAVFFSDYEGISLSLLEAIRAGALPLYPQFGEGDFSGQAANFCHYSPGNLQDLFDHFRALEQAGPLILAQVRADLGYLLANRSPQAYLLAMSQWADLSQKEWKAANLKAETHSRPLSLGWVGSYNRAYARLTLGT